MFRDFTNYENEFIKVISRNESDKIYPSGRKVAQWNCLCKKCNSNIFFIKTSDWIRNYSHIGCGCESHDIRVKANGKRTHGMTKTPIYKKWLGMKTRCDNSNEKSYKNYGGRGISYCDEWANFENFYNWAINNGYLDGLSLERINVNGNYCPENCKWITMTDQQQNKRNTIKIEYEGKQWSLRNLCNHLNLNYKSVTSRIYQQGFTPLEAVATPFDGTLYPSSKMEKFVESFLSENKIEYTRNKTYDDLLGVGGRKLSYDFYLPEYNVLIECQGLQHKRPAMNWDGGAYFETQKEHDRRKKEYANKNNITLIEIFPEDLSNINDVLNNLLIA